MLSLSGSLKKCCKKRVKVTQCTVSCKCIPCRITGGKIRVAWFLSALEGAEFFGNFGETLHSQSTSNRISAGAAVLAKITSVCAKIYGLGVTSWVYYNCRRR